MRASEYIDKATAFIASGALALEVRRELEAHLKEAIAEVEAQGIDPETAELVAVARMGDPSQVAIDLAEAHHQHLPWRHYLAVIPVMVLLFGNLFANQFQRGPMNLIWLTVLVLCLVPDLSILKGWALRLWLDASAKLHRVGRISLRAPLVAGLASGGVAGALFAAAASAHLGDFLFFLGVFVLPFCASVAMLSFFRTQVAATHAAGFASITFPLFCLPALYALGRLNAVAVGLSICGGYAFLIFGAAWIIDRVAAKRQMVRT